MELPLSRLCYMLLREHHQTCPSLWILLPYEPFARHRPSQLQQKDSPTIQQGVRQNQIEEKQFLPQTLDLTLEFSSIAECHFHNA